MKKFILLFALLISAATTGWGQIVYEPYNYTPDATNGLAKQSSGVWKTVNSGDSILVTAGNLSYTGLQSSAGNSVTFGGSGTDYYRPLGSSITSGTVYMSFLLNLSTLGTLGTGGGYQVGFLDGGTTNYCARLYTRLSGTSGYNLGINAVSTSGNIAWASNVLTPGTTYLIVISYQFVSGTTNDIAKIWINPSIGATEPTANATSTNSGTDESSIQRIFLRQGSTTDTPQAMVVDEMRVGASWSDVMGAFLTISPNTLTGFSYFYENGPSTSQSYNLSGTNLTGAPGNITVTGSTNYEVSSDNSSFSSTALISYSSATLSATPVFVRLKSGLLTGNYNSENVSSAGGGAASQNLTCSGTVYKAAPSTQASALTFSSVGSTLMTASWTAGNGDKRVVIINTTNSFTNPANGTDPEANTSYSGTGEQVVYNNNGTSVNVTGLSPSTTYWFRVYEYNNSGVNTQFNTAAGTDNPKSQATGGSSTAPVITTPTSASITNNSAILGGFITSDGGSAITERGTVWKTSSGVTIDDNKLTEGGTTTGVFSHTRSSLPAKAHVYFKAFAANLVGTTLTDESNFYTLADEPTTHVSDFTAIADGSTSIGLSWSGTSTGADGYLVLQKTGATSPTGLPSDANAYTVGNVIGDGTVAAIVTPGSATSQSITGLNAASTYSFTIIPFASDGSNAQTYNYKTDSSIPSASASTDVPTYTWSGADNGSWVVSTNWTPERTSATINDILQFSDGTTKTISSVPVETIGKLVLSGNTTVNLQASGTNTLTIGGGTGTDLDVPAGSSLNISGANTLVLYLSAGVTGTVSGSMSFTNAAHKIDASDAAGIRFLNGSTLTQGTSCSGNIFTNANTENAIRFESGSTFIQETGSNPYGLVAPKSKVEFQTGSLFKYKQNSAPSFSNRTCANFEIDFSGFSQTISSGTTSFTADDFKITQGILTISTNLPIICKGNLTIASGQTFNYSPSTAATITFQGSSIQTIDGSGTLTLGSNSTLAIDNSNGVTLNRSLDVGGTLTLTSGALSIGSNTLTLNGDISVTSGTLTGGATSNITFGGSGSNTTLPAVSGGLNNLTINRSNGITLGGGVQVNGILELQSGAITNTSGYLSYNGGTLKYNGTGYNSTSDAEFPSSNGPANLEINNADAAGISLHATRTLSGNLTIANGKIFKLASGINLTVGGTFTNSSDATGLTLADGASLITNGTVSGGATVSRTISGPAWHQMSAPVTGQTIFEGYTDMYAWDEANYQWLNHNGGTFPDATYLPGKGYLVSWTAGATKDFAGTLNSGDFTTGSGSVPAITYTSGKGNGFNLMGNPYPSALSGTIDTWTKTNVDNSIWVYDNGSYLTWNGSTGTLTEGIIPAMQGFWVKANATGPSMTIPNTARTHSTQSYYKSAKALQDMILLSVEGNGYKDGIVVNFNDEATEGYDGTYDVLKMYGDAAAPQFFCQAADKELSIDVLPYSRTRTIPLGLKVGYDNTYTLRVKENTFYPSVSIVLEDLKTGQSIDLQTHPEYTFNALTSDNASRFKLHFGGALGVDDPKTTEALSIYANDNQLCLAVNAALAGDVYVYNMVGQLLLQQKLENSALTRIAITGPSGYYLVKVVTGQKTFTGKVFIR